MGGWRGANVRITEITSKGQGQPWDRFWVDRIWEARAVANSSCSPPRGSQTFHVRSLIRQNKIEAINFSNTELGQKKSQNSSVLLLYYLVCRKGFGGSVVQRERLGRKREVFMLVTELTRPSTRSSLALLGSLKGPLQGPHRPC